jgi:hypothetical protein
MNSLEERKKRELDEEVAEVKRFWEDSDTSGEEQGA